MKESMGQIIRRLRKASGLTQDRLAELLNVSSQAVSKWETDSAMPDISQVVPLATVLGVQTDVLFGLAEQSVDEEALETVREAENLFDPYRPETLSDRYDRLMEGLKKYPNHPILLVGCMECGLTLSLPENGELYCAERADEIARETIRQANRIISYSENTSDVLRAHQVLLLLYAGAGEYETAMSEAKGFPVRTDFTYYGNMAYISRAMKDFGREIVYLQNSLDMTLQAMENDIARLADAYIRNGNPDGAIRVCKGYFGCMKALFGDLYPPYHDFDSGNLHLILAGAHLAKGDTQAAMEVLDGAVGYYLDMLEQEGEYIRRFAGTASSPFIRDGAKGAYIDRSPIEFRIRAILSGKEWATLCDHPRAKAILDRIERLIG